MRCHSPIRNFRCLWKVHNVADVTANKPSNTNFGDIQAPPSLPRGVLHGIANHVVLQPLSPVISAHVYVSGTCPRGLKVSFLSARERFTAVCVNQWCLGE